MGWLSQFINEAMGQKEESWFDCQQEARYFLFWKCQHWLRGRLSFLFNAHWRLLHW